ncbi:Uncharacterised protein [uncultured archaeon]|nr:Uncharacterised protein [uncultured archaeon]
MKIFLITMAIFIALIIIAVVVCESNLRKNKSSVNIEIKKEQS